MTEKQATRIAKQMKKLTEQQDVIFATDQPDYTTLDALSRSWYDRLHDLHANGYQSCGHKTVDYPCPCVL